jgi:hypothetical protein
MRNLPVPVIKDEVTFNEISNAKINKYRKRLKKVRPRVKVRYEAYIKNATALESLPPSQIVGVYSEALIKCYSSRTAIMDELRDELLYPDLENFDTCPFCGIGEPTTLDHYLPKEEFPEFSVLSKNLIPVCGVCNSNYKGTKWIDNYQRLFVHTYYDIFPNYTFLGAQVIVGTKISIDFDALFVASEPSFSTLFSKHVEKLGLKRRYKRKASSEVSRKRRQLEVIYKRNGSALDVVKALKDEALALEKDFSGNNWKTALYKALSRSLDFCDAGFRKRIAK